MDDGKEELLEEDDDPNVANDVTLAIKTRSRSMPRRGAPRTWKRHDVRVTFVVIRDMETNSRDG
jgi:hypothetical protein